MEVTPQVRKAIGPKTEAAELEEIAPRCEMSQAQQLVDALAQEVFRLRSELAEIAQLA